jgi:ankyrin repeat protein
MLDSPSFAQAYRESTGLASTQSNSDNGFTRVNSGSRLQSEESARELNPYANGMTVEGASSADIVEPMVHKHPEIIKAILSSDPNLRLPADSIMLAIRENDVAFAKLLFDYGANVNGLIDGVTPLCAALICHRSEDHQNEMVDLLLSRGADVDKVCPELVLRQHSLQGLVKTEPLDQSRPDGIPTYCQACAGEKEISVDGFYTYFGYKAYNVAPIHLAALYRCHLGPLQAILSCKPNNNARYSLQLSKIPQDLEESKIFAREHYNPIGATNISALHDASSSHIAILSRAGVFLDAHDSCQLSPLSWAILAGDVPKVEALLNAGCPLREAGPNCDAIAIWFQSIPRPLPNLYNDESRLVILDLLLKAGADTSVPPQTATQNWPLGTRVEFEASMLKKSTTPSFWQHCDEMIKAAWSVDPASQRAAFLQGTEDANMAF